MIFNKIWRSHFFVKISHKECEIFTKMWDLCQNVRFSPTCEIYTILYHYEYRLHNKFQIHWLARYCISFVWRQHWGEGMLWTRLTKKQKHRFKVFTLTKPGLERLNWNDCFLPHSCRERSYGYNVKISVFLSVLTPQILHYQGGHRGGWALRGQHFCCSS